MILIDFSHLFYRNLFTTIYNVKPKKQNGKYNTDDFIDVFFFQMLNSLRKIEDDFKNEYGDIVLLMDGRGNWRKEYLKHDGTYKDGRSQARSESDIDYDTFYAKIEELKNYLKHEINYKIIEVEGVEADDSGFILSHHIDEKTLLVTEDKDWKQCLIDNYNVDMYRPIAKEMIYNKSDDYFQNHLREFRALHILVGDKADSIPSVLDKIEYTKEFLTFLSNEGIKVTKVSEFEKLNFAFDIYKKADILGIEIFKKARFGEKTALKLLKSPTEFINKKIKDKKRFYDNLRKNRTLVDMRKIPYELKEKVIEEFKSETPERKETMFLEQYNITKCKDFNLNNCNEVENSKKMKSIFDF